MTVIEHAIVKVSNTASYKMDLDAPFSMTRDTTKAIPGGTEGGAPKPDPSVSPDVINKAVEVAEGQHGGLLTFSADVRRMIDAAAPVLLGAGREQEQARIRDEVKARMDRAREDYDRDPQAYHRGREDELDLLLDFLSPVSEEPGGRDEVSSDASASAAATSLGSEPTTEEGENRE